MANDLNSCSFIGRLGKDPETRYMPSGDAVTNTSVAVGEQWKDKQTGQKQERTEWVRCCAFGRLAEVMSQYLTKGSQVFISGKLRTRKWTDQSGNDRYSTEIVVDKMQLLGGNPSTKERDFEHKQSVQKVSPAVGREDFNDIPF